MALDDEKFILKDKFGRQKKKPGKETEHLPIVSECEWVSVCVCVCVSIFLRLHMRMRVCVRAYAFMCNAYDKHK